uniref:ZP domain-containing protein n=1 Tax=Panagrellus redivivus TaxID=6233 RepID=A0A7E4W7V2_PANRE
MFIPLLGILVLLFAGIYGQNNAVANRKINVLPRCGSQLITIEIQFDENEVPNGKFTDWIIVGDSNRPECRLRGNGELQYVVEIAVFDDPCETRMIAPGVFQNTIRIAQLPAIVLQDDFNFTVKCIYGSPEVQQHQQNKVVKPNFEISGNVIPETFDPELSIPNGSIDSGSVGVSSQPDLGLPSDFLESLNKQAASSKSIFEEFEANGPGIFTTLGLTPASTPIERTPVKNSNLIVETATDETPETTVSPMGVPISGNSAGNTGSATGGNIIAILLTAFIVLAVMIMLILLFLCLRNRYWDDLGENKAVANSPADSGSGIHPKNSEVPWWSGKGPNGGGGTYLLPSEYRVNRTPSGISADDHRTHTSYTSAESDDLDRHSVRAIDVPSNYRHAAAAPVHEAFRNRSTPTGSSAGSNPLPAMAHRGQALEEDDLDDDSQMNSTTQSYAEWRERMLTQHEPAMGPPKEADLPQRCLTPVRSITEIYRSAETHLQKLMNDEHGHSRGEGQSSDEGEYSLPRNENVGISRGASGDDLEEGLDANTVDKLIRCVEKIRGFGSRKLTEQEIARWRQLISNDVNLQEKIVSAKSLDELKVMCEHPDYRLYFTRTKWSHIMQCVAEVLFNAKFASPAGSFSMGTVQRDTLVRKPTNHDEESNTNGSMLNVYVGNMSSNPGGW